jgi:drug/metabolite transporter (DMT)-like permease
MIFIILSILLISFNNVLWKIYLKENNTFFLISFRSFITSLTALTLLFFSLNNFPNKEDFIKITLGSLLGVTGLICMLTLLKKHSLQWLGIYNLFGVFFTGILLYVFEGFKTKISLLGSIIIILGYGCYLIFNTKKHYKIGIKAHLLFFLTIFCFSSASFVHWKNLTRNLDPILIIANQEIVVFIVSSLILYFKYKSTIKITNYITNLNKVVIMSLVIILSLYFGFRGVKITNPLISALLLLSGPLTTIVFSAFFFKERLTLKQLVPMALIFIGAFIISFQNK